MSSSPVLPGFEERVRDALASGQLPEIDDVRALVHTLDQVRRESEERWQAIGRLAPAAKAGRQRRQELERTLQAMDASLGELAHMFTAETGPTAQDVHAWLARARQHLESGEGASRRTD